MILTLSNVAPTAQEIETGHFLWEQILFFFLFFKCQEMSTTFLPLQDYAGVVYRKASAHSASVFHSVFHGTLRFITVCKPLTHHWTLFSRAKWLSVSPCRTMHRYIFIHNFILDLLPFYQSIYHDPTTASALMTTSPLPSFLFAQNSVKMSFPTQLPPHGTAGTEAAQLDSHQGAATLCGKLSAGVF